MEIRNDDYSTISYEADLNAVHVVWKKIPTEGMYREIFTGALNAIIDNKANKWISDIRKQGVVGPSNAKWLREEILPKAIQAGLNKIAIVVEKDVFKKFYIDNVKTIMSATAEMQYFDSEDEARKWLG
ncbi:STAS/SEC14 domain-containing protein [Fulvivirga ligni]|uniref:STAS/SEC14 domain-containing protein n=1 Tax=Fulvivirga ligni TaxID=2904246 RepID=UPI001F34F34F|nr:STAS/SEC14 domain-containing protein [Fulvivirga ligni]UII22454.1 STAS/SEC14 domain-containing protein [Fulvivirga ligni]